MKGKARAGQRERMSTSLTSTAGTARSACREGSGSGDACRLHPTQAGTPQLIQQRRSVAEVAESATKVASTDGRRGEGWRRGVEEEEEVGRMDRRGQGGSGGRWEARPAPPAALSLCALRCGVVEWV